jgi:NAD(P)-dependent dehydrogenase (short-subunit alcohol dehydrogenase family)
MAGSAIVIGSSGGIGVALVQALGDEAHYAPVLGLSRAARDFDLTDEASIAAAAAKCAKAGPPALIIVATGLLHDDKHRPERSFRELDPAWMARNYAINAIGPALIAKHFLPLLPKGERSVFAILSARVGSISDNQQGGWHSYRASKAALNMLVRNFALELHRTQPNAICVGLHPGTVDTPLSQPFKGNVAPGKLFDRERAALQLLDVVDGLKGADSGKCLAWDGEEIPA